MEMAMEDSRSSTLHPICSMAFEAFSSAVRTRRFAKNPIPSSPRISLVGVWFHVELLNMFKLSSVEEVEET
ncbi:hypothetical protein Goshw_007692 [Gossypium schwendimanii]|uniref:Uncharacterized protein n=4 Tax=Gossypium TaxID=3633 RepID=A0A7J9MN28_GOSSC|nr:hypothetical protein [Gossypium lobatum]MBA0726759.1 hypothetical protein [Gossypium laxum]MBA0814943.1 hypothetical protein [Gossypium harknessii]MBA0872136.1 hypothetical protein [Gossypium schwendimanii]